MASKTPSQGYGRVTLPGGNKDLEYILLWRDPAKTGVIFGAITLAYVLLEWTKYSLLQILANILLLAVSAAFLWNNLASFTGRSGVPLPRILQTGVSESEMKGIAVDVTAVVNKALAFARKLATGRDVILSIQVAAALYAIAKFSSYFSTLGLAYTLVVLAFVLPKIYEIRKDDIDRTYYTVANETQKHYNTYVDPYVRKLPRGSTATSSSAGNSTAEVQRKVEATMDDATSNVKSGLNQGIDQAQHTYNQASKNTSSGFDDLSHQAGRTMDNMSHQAGQAYNQAADTAGRAYDQAANQASRTYDQASNQASHTYNQTANQASHTYNQTTGQTGGGYGSSAQQPGEGFNRMANDPTYNTQGSYKY